MFPKLLQCPHLWKQWWTEHSMDHTSCCALKSLSTLSPCLLTVKFSKGPPVQAIWLQSSWKIQCLETAFGPRTKSRRATYRCQEEQHHFWSHREEKEQGWHLAGTHQREQKCILLTFFHKERKLPAVFKSIFFTCLVGQKELFCLSAAP